VSVESLMEDLANVLPVVSRRKGGSTIREVCLTRYDDGSWSVMAGGHPAVHIGEWGGDFDGSGATAEAALADCLNNVIRNT
jgi:hypothetical protein